MFKEIFGVIINECNYFFPVSEKNSTSFISRGIEFTHVGIAIQESLNHPPLNQKLLLSRECLCKFMPWRIFRQNHDAIIRIFSRKAYFLHICYVILVYYIIAHGEHLSQCPIIFRSEFIKIKRSSKTWWRMGTITYVNK